LALNAEFSEERTPKSGFKDVGILATLGLRGGEDCSGKVEWGIGKELRFVIMGRRRACPTREDEKIERGTFSNA
jgi:hypothetical protein